MKRRKVDPSTADTALVFGVIVTRSINRRPARRTHLLVEVETPGDWEAAADHALARCRVDKDVDWMKLSTRPAIGRPVDTALIDQSLRGEEMVTLLTAARDRLGGLDPDERVWLDEVIRHTRIHDNEIRRFRAAVVQPARG